jgi:hypothetical protein
VDFLDYRGAVLESVVADVYFFAKNSRPQASALACRT